jgi:predicted RNase H-like HicB family nuclease
MDIPVAIHKDENSVYGVVVPSVPGCFSWGDTLEGALTNARQAIYSHIQAMMDEGIPVEIGQTKIDDLAESDAYLGATWAVVQVDLSKIRSAPAQTDGTISS